MNLKRIRRIIKNDKRYLDALKESDRTLSIPKFDVRKNFTIDEEIFNAFQDKCSKEGTPMSKIVEKLMKEYV